MHADVVMLVSSPLMFYCLLVSHRVLINERNSEHQRYEVKDALVAPPVANPVTWQLDGANSATVKFSGTSKAVLYAKPFR